MFFKQFKNNKIITLSGTWINPGLDFVYLTLVAGGDSGFGNESVVYVNGGGCGNSIIQRKINVSQLSSAIVTIGKGGRGYYRDIDNRGLYTASVNGENGQSSSFNGIVVAGGGTDSQNRRGGWRGTVNGSNYAYASVNPTDAGAGITHQNSLNGAGHPGPMLFFDDDYVDFDSNNNLVKSSFGWGAGGHGSYSNQTTSNHIFNPGCGVQGVCILEW